MVAALLALWNDYPAEMAAEYEAWHTFEHVPERLTVPGMRAARRYVCATNAEAYFTLYELNDLAVIKHDAYLDLVRNPTPWSRKMREHFSNVLRIPGEIAGSQGCGIGGATLVYAYSVEKNQASVSVPGVTSVLSRYIDDARIVGFSIAVAEPNQIYEVFTQHETTDSDTVNVVIVIEGNCSNALSVVQDTLAKQVNALLQPRKCLRHGLFNLLISYRGEDFPSDRSAVLRRYSPQSHY